MGKLIEFVAWMIPVSVILGCLYYLTSVSPVDIYEFFEALEKVKK